MPRCQRALAGVHIYNTLQENPSLEAKLGKIVVAARTSDIKTEELPTQQFLRNKKELEICKIKNKEARIKLKIMKKENKALCQISLVHFLKNKG